LLMFVVFDGMFLLLGWGGGGGVGGCYVASAVTHVYYQ